MPWELTYAWWSVPPHDQPADRGLHRVIGDDLIRANARRAVPGTDLSVGASVIVGDDDWGVAPAEVVEHDEATWALILKVLAELRPQGAGAMRRWRWP